VLIHQCIFYSVVNHLLSNNLFLRTLRLKDDNRYKKLADSKLALSKKPKRDETKEETHESEDNKQELDGEEELGEGVEWINKIAY
jgi:hypothetical protein